MKLHHLALAAALTIPSIAHAAWEAKEKKDPFTDKVSYVVTGVPQSGNDRMRMIVQCDDNALMLGFRAGAPMTGLEVSTLYRFDDAQPANLKLLNLSSTPYASSRDTSAVIAEIPGHKTLAIRLSDRSGNSTQAVFDLAGAADPVREALRRCPIKK